MINTLSRKSVLGYPVLWIVACIALTGLYAWSLQQNIFIAGRNYVVWSIQLGVDLLLGFYGFMAYKSRQDQASKKFYLLMFISLIPVIFANEIYNFFVQIPALRNVSLDIKIHTRLYWCLSYLLFLYGQFAAWYYLLSMTRKNNDSRQSWLAIYPHLSSALMICAAFIFIILSVHPEIIELKIFNSVLEIAVFALISICLSRTRDKHLNYIEIGFLLLTAICLAHLFADRSNHYFRVFDIAWTCCLMLITYGLRVSCKTGNEKIQFYEKNSIHVYVTGAFILLANVVLILFIVIASVMSVMQGSYLAAIPRALIFAFLTTLLLAKFFADRLSQPLDSVVDRIDNLREKIL